MNWFALTEPADRLADFNGFPAHVWNRIRAGTFDGRALFVTGATGFAGSWLLAAIARLNARLASPLQVRALTRQPRTSVAPWLTWVRGDVRDVRDDVHADLVVHAALPSTATPPGGESDLRDTALRGMDSVLAYAQRAGVARTLVLSSGAVYGRSTGAVAESFPFQPLDPADTYASAKREVEAIAQAAAGPAHDVVIARLFTCIGAGYRGHAHLVHVALLEAARSGRPLTLRGDGTAVRSYLYGADLAAWLLTLLGGSGSDVVNVGSDLPMTVLGFAQRVARAAKRGHEPVVTGPETETRRPYFVPDITRARTRYSLAPWTTVELAIARSLAAAGTTPGPASTIGAG